MSESEDAQCIVCDVTSSNTEDYGYRAWLWPTIFYGKFCLIPRASSQNNVAHCSKIV